MRGYACRLIGAGLLAVSLSACPLTDDYYIDSASGGTDGALLETGGGAATSSTGGSSSSAAGHAEPTSGGESGTGGTGSSGCLSWPERCNGRDDNCNQRIDEQACGTNANGTTGCSGFVISGRPDHGYMVCTGAERDYAHAQEACAAQQMHLAWLESAEENAAVAAKIGGAVTDVWIGASDIATEGSWAWDGGAQFWSGNQSGKPVGGMFTAWATGTPNNANNNEDCGVLMPASATWGDRACGGKLAYLCEEPGP